MPFLVVVGILLLCVFICGIIAVPVIILLGDTEAAQWVWLALLTACLIDRK